jgi:hypothetical protein
MTRKPPPPFILIPDLVSHDTMRALEQLIDGVRRREVIGIAYAAALKRRAYIVNSTGECYRNPTWSRGLIAALDDQLAVRIRGGND